MDQLGPASEALRVVIKKFANERPTYPVTRTLRAGVVALIAGTLLAVVLEACLTELLFEDDDDGACVCPEAPNASRCV